MPWLSCRSWSAARARTCEWPNSAVWPPLLCKSTTEKSFPCNVEPSKEDKKHVHFLQDDSLGVRCSGEGIGLPASTQMRFLVVLVRPNLDATVGAMLARSPDSVRFSHDGWRKRWIIRAKNPKNAAAVGRRGSLKWWKIHGAYRISPTHPQAHKAQALPIMKHGHPVAQTKKPRRHAHKVRIIHCDTWTEQLELC